MGSIGFSSLKRTGTRGIPTVGHSGSMLVYARNICSGSGHEALGQRDRPGGDHHNVGGYSSSAGRQARRTKCVQSSPTIYSTLLLFDSGPFSLRLIATFGGNCNGVGLRGCACACGRAGMSRSVAGTACSRIIYMQGQLGNKQGTVKARERLRGRWRNQ